MLKRILGLVGGKWGLYAILAAALTIAGLYGYIRYQGLQLENANTKLNQAQSDIRQRDHVISAQQQEAVQYQARVQAISDAMEHMQSAIAQNAQQRRTDYGSMTRPHPLPGQPLDTKDLEDAANTGMNGLFADLVRLSQPLTSNPVQDKPNASK